MDVKKDIIYIEGSTDPKHTLDIYTPDRSRGFIVWFHGGGLSNGKKNSDETLHAMKVLAGLGFTMASVGYRLYPGVSFPGQVEDAAAAIRFIKKDLYDGSGPFVAAGHSAGAWLACMAVMDTVYLPDGLVDGIIPISGQMALHTRVAEELGIPAADPNHPAAPAAHVRDGLPGILMMAGDHDNPGRWDQQVLLESRLTNAGYVTHRAMQIADRDHGGIIRRMGEPGDPVTEAIITFMPALADETGRSTQ
jgi:hypothetical protein